MIERFTHTDRFGPVTVTIDDDTVTASNATNGDIATGLIEEDSGLYDFEFIGNFLEQEEMMADDFQSLRDAVERTVQR